MSSPFITFSEVNSCSACPAGTIVTSLTSVPNDETSCQNACTCPNGTPTVATGYDATLCDFNTATVDCSACNVGYKLSSAAASGSAQKCIPKCAAGTYITASDGCASMTKAICPPGEGYSSASSVGELMFGSTSVSVKKSIVGVIFTSSSPSIH